MDEDKLKFDDGAQAAANDGNTGRKQVSPEKLKALQVAMDKIDKT